MCSNFPEFHCHTQSLDSASTLDNFAKREVELGTGYLTSTDHGTLQATRLVYDLCHGKYKNNLKPVLGCEVYFRDDACPIMTTAGIPKGADGTFRDTFKYGHLTVHCLDEAAYSTLSIVMSDADLRAETHGSERKPLLDWSMLARLGEQNMTCGSGCLISAINRHLLRGDWESAKKYYEQVRGLFKPGNFYAEVFPHVCDRNWESKVDIIDPKGVVTPFRTWKKIKLANGDTMSAEELAHELAKHPEATKNYLAVVEVMDARAWKVLERPIELATCTLKEGWVINECTPHTPNGDWQFRANQFILDMARKYGDPVVISGDAHFAYEKEKIVQDVRLAQSGSWRMSTSYHRRSSSDAWKHFESVGVVRKEFDGWVQNNIEWASRFDGFKFSPKQPLPTKFYPKDTLKHTLKLVHDHGRMDWNNPEMVSRLETEIQLLHKNGTVDLLPYFMVDEEVCSEYAKRGELTGPGRGSAAGVLLAYLLGITHVNPLRYKLSLDRFLTLDRIQTGKFPDIDQDLTSRDILVGPNEEGGWLQERFGDCVAQISIDTTIRLKNAIKDTFRAAERMAGNQNPRVPPEIEAFCKTLPIPPQGISDHDFVFGYQDDSGAQIPGLIETHAGLQRFSKKYPEHWETIQMVLGLSRQKSRHACAFVINSEPISSFIPLQTVGGVRCTSFTAPAVEAAGGLKMDFLVVNNLKDIQKAIKLIQQRHKVNCEIVDGFGRINGIPTPACRIVPLGDQVFDIYDLPSCESVYKDICDGRVETVFQFDAPAARMGFSHFRTSGDVLPLSSIDDLAVFTALDRPGPLNTDVVDEHGNAHNMLVEFSRRAKGLPKVGAIDVLDTMLPETKGVCCFQESCQEVFHKVGQTTAIEANNFRYRFSKKKMVECDKKDRPIFMKGAVPLVGQEKADKIWNTLYSFAGYAFNKCVSGDTVVVRAGTNKTVKSPEITIQELWDAQQSKTPWGKKIRSGRLQLMHLSKDGRVRFGHLKKVIDNGIANTVLITTNTGKTIRVTPNHRLLGSAGYVEAQHLRVGDGLVCVGSETKTPKGHTNERARGVSYIGCGMPTGKSNPAWVDGRTSMLKTAKEVAKARANGRCEACGVKLPDGGGHGYEFAHTKSLADCGGDFSRYHNADNGRILCNSCHKSFDYKKNERKKRGTKGLPTTIEKIVSIEDVGMTRVFDLEMDTEEHNFVANGIVSHNSHAVCYVVISYACAWLKHNYPLEWWSAVLSNATRKEIDEKFWGYCGQMILLPDIQRSKKDFTVEEDKIRAPLSLLHGLGDKAHQQLLEGAPYSSIKGLLEHIQKWRVDNAKPVQKVDKKTGETKTVLKKAVSAVNTTVIQRLIVSGVMDSLFQPSESGTPLTVHEKLAEFSFALREVTGNKKFNALSSKYNLDSPVVLFQVRKSILPAYSEPLARLVQKIMPWRFKGKDALTFYGGNTEDTVGEVRERWRVISGRQYEALQQVPPLSASMNVAMVGYVVTERRFEYTQKTTGDKKVACELTLDVEGTHVAVVKWPSKDGLPPSFNKKMTGAIVVAFFVRGEGRQDFFFAELVTVAPPLGTEEENDESEEASK